MSELSADDTAFLKRMNALYQKELQRDRDRRLPRKITPIDVVIAKLRSRKVGLAVQRRVARLNPQGVYEGAPMRGYHPKATIAKSYNIDVCTRKQFEKLWGNGSSRRLPKDAFVNAGGKRRWIYGMAIATGPSFGAPN